MKNDRLKKVSLEVTETWLSTRTHSPRPSYRTGARDAVAPAASTTTTEVAMVTATRCSGAGRPSFRPHPYFCLYSCNNAHAFEKLNSGLWLTTPKRVTPVN